MKFLLKCFLIDTVLDTPFTAAPPQWVESRRKVIWGTLWCGRGLSEGWALLKECIRSGLPPRKGGDPGTLGSRERIWWAAEGLAEAPWEVSPASGTLVPQFWPPRLGCCLPAVVHRALRWRQAWRGRKKRLDPRWGCGHLAAAPPPCPSPPDGTV